MAKVDLKEQAKEIIRIAEESGAQSNFFFVTTFKRYQVQLGILEDLEKEIKADGMIVEKEYVKGRKNVTLHPAVRAYNSTTDSANKTCIALMKILKGYGADKKTEDIDPLMAMINGD